MLKNEIRNKLQFKPNAYPATSRLCVQSKLGPLTDTLVSGQLYLRPPSQSPDLLNSHTNSVFSHSRKRPAPVTDTFFAPRGCPLMRASTVFSFCHAILARLERRLWRTVPSFRRLFIDVQDKFSDRLIKELLNSVFAKYRDLSVASRSIIRLSLRQRIDPLATDKSRYFAQPHPIIVNYHLLL